MPVVGILYKHYKKEKLAVEKACYLPYNYLWQMIWKYR